MQITAGGSGLTSSCFESFAARQRLGVKSFHLDCISPAQRLIAATTLIRKNAEGLEPLQ
jgi:hypothetical protein